MRRYLLLGLIASVVAACQDPAADYRKNIHRNACNALNGAYRGQIVSVEQDPVNHSGVWVYGVQRPGSRQTWAPVDNTTVTDGPCPDGQP